MEVQPRLAPTVFSLLMRERKREGVGGRVRDREREREIGVE